MSLDLIVVSRTMPRARGRPPSRVASVAAGDRRHGCRVVAARAPAHRSRFRRSACPSRRRNARPRPRTRTRRPCRRSTVGPPNRGSRTGSAVRYGATHMPADPALTTSSPSRASAARKKPAPAAPKPATPTAGAAPAATPAVMSEASTKPLLRPRVGQDGGRTRGAGNAGDDAGNNAGNQDCSCAGHRRSGRCQDARRGPIDRTGHRSAVDLGDPTWCIRGEVSLNREVYSYDPGARRDPFVSLMRTGDLRPMLSDLRLVTVLYDPTGRNSIAVMRDLSTKDQYRVRVGQTLGRMRVAQIQPQARGIHDRRGGFQPAGSAGAR